MKLEWAGWSTRARTAPAAIWTPKAAPVDISATARDRASLVALVVAITVFIGHALNYLYFFVDDEAIPFVFARHLLEGKGLVYNSIEGRVEGYSDLLHVILATGYLAASRALGLGPLSVFFIAKAVSFASGICVVVLLWRAFVEDVALSGPARVAALTFVALAPPLAMWSCSSLEMALGTLLVTLITIGALDSDGTHDTRTAVAACLLMLLRIDGVISVGALLVPACLLASPARRRTLIRRIAVPVVGTLVALHAWRVWYFGDWLSAPLVAKVMHRLRPVANVLSRDPVVPYGWAFLHLYGVVPVVALGLFVVTALRENRRAWALLTSTAILLAYAATVGDWMMGFRFFLPAIPPLACLIAMAINRIRAPRIAWVVALVGCFWFAGVALRAAVEFERVPYLSSWLAHPSADATRYFRHYYRLYDDLRPIVPPGTLIAYDQAGFVPFMLNAENIDDLGVCSRFVAGLPTTDIVFTQVGRYSPLTNASALMTAQSYLLYRAPAFIIEPLDNLRSANPGGIPETVLRGYYRKALVDGHTNAAVYRRVADPTPAFRSNPHAFLENVAHPSRVLHAFDGATVPPSEYLPRLRFLAAGTLDRVFSGRMVYDVVFGKTDVPTYELHVNSLWARANTRVVLTLLDRSGNVVKQETRLVSARQADQLATAWPDGPKASRLWLELAAPPGEQTHVILTDLRVQGQPPELERYVHDQLFRSNR
jgi:hypothetical protein